MNRKGSITMKGNRWYDKHPKLSMYLDRLKDLDDEERDEIIVGIMVLIKKECPNLLEEFVMEFPLPLYRKRWYDKDPYLWILFNGLKYANASLIERVTKYLELNSK